MPGIEGQPSISRAHAEQRTPGVDAWCDVEIGLCDYVAPASFRGWLVAISTIAVRAIKRRIKRSTAAWAVVRKLRMLTGSLRG